MPTGEVFTRRLFDPSFSAPRYFQDLNLLENRLDALIQGIPYLTDDQLVDLFSYLRGLDQHTWKAQAAILWEAKRRSVYGDRAWEAMGRSFGIGWRQAYNLARVWEVFFLAEKGQLCNQLQYSTLQEVTWYIVASETDAPHFWLAYADDRKAEDPGYSVADFKECSPGSLTPARLRLWPLWPVPWFACKRRASSRAGSVGWRKDSRRKGESMAQQTRRIERLEQQLAQEQEAAALPPLIILADRPARTLDELTYSELLALKGLEDPLPTGESDLATEEQHGGRQIFRFHLTAAQVWELTRDREAPRD